MIKLSDLLTEGVYDPGIFKAVFMAGGPGSGKTSAARGIFGISGEWQSVSQSTGLKYINSDNMFEYLFKKEKGQIRMDLSALSADDFWSIYAGDNPESMRVKAKELVHGKMFDNFIKGKLGIIIDITSRDVSRVEKKKKLLEDNGYDCYMIFVNTSLNIAIERNNERDRKLPNDIVESIWEAVQKNIVKYKGIFGTKNFIELSSDNLEYDWKTGQSKIPKAISKVVNKWVNGPIKNKIAKDWITKMKDLKNKMK